MIKIRATHKLHNIVFTVKDEEALWIVVNECLKRLHVHYGLILKTPSGLKIEIMEMLEGQASKPKTEGSVKGL